MTDWSAVLKSAFAAARENAGDTGDNGDAPAKRLQLQRNCPPKDVTTVFERLVTPVTARSGVTGVTNQRKGVGDSGTCKIGDNSQGVSYDVTSVTGVTTQNGEPAHSSLQRLKSSSIPSGFSSETWQLLLSNTKTFLNEWANEAATLGWSDVDLVGVHPVAPTARYDAMGLLLLIRNGRVVEMQPDRATIRMPSGSALVYVRRVSAAVPVYSLA